jgi:hypothetical protein
MSTAKKIRVSKIVLYVWKHPFCSFLKILNDGKITKNREDLKHDLEFLSHFGCIQQILFIQRYYAYPVTKDLEYMIKLFKNMDDMISIIRKNPRIKDTWFGNEIKKIRTSNEKVNAAKILRICNESDYPTDKFAKIFSLLIGNFLQKCKINEYENRKNPFIVDRKILDDVDELATLIKLFLEPQKYFEKNIYSYSDLVNKITSYLEQRYDIDKKYIDTFRSSRRYPLKKRIEMWNDLLYSGDVDFVKEKYCLPSNKAIRNALKSIRDQQGRPDMMKIMELNNIEKNRYAPNVSIKEVALLAVRYKIRNALDSCIPKSDEYNELNSMIKKELPGLLAI